MAKRNLPFGGITPMEPGERDRAVLIQQLAESDGVSGFPVETWTTLHACVWMRKLELQQKERFVAGQLSSPATCQWELPYLADMDPELVDVTKKRRLVSQGRVYDITSGSQIGRRDGIELLTLTGGRVTA